MAADLHSYVPPCWNLQLLILSPVIATLNDSALCSRGHELIFKLYDE